VKKNICAIYMLTVFSCSSTFALTLDQRQIANEERQVSFAERVIVVGKGDGFIFATLIH
jgi:hypothetical protein